MFYSSDVDECASNPCVNGNCSSQENGFTCSCEPGWRGMQCDGMNAYLTHTPLIMISVTENINECESNPCQNGGVCTDNVNGYTCSCADGYNGTDCEGKSF